MSQESLQPTGHEQEKLAPTKELVTPDGYRWFTYSSEQTGLMLACLENQENGLVVTTSLANPEKRSAAHKAWAGARHSRAPGMPWEIMAEMGEKGVDPDEKLDTLFSTYGHASVGDMARVEVDIVNAPMHLCFSLFNNTSINSGQEKSTRYQQKFGDAILHSVKNYLPKEFSEEEVNRLEEKYQALGELSLELFAKHQEKLTEAFTDYYEPQNKRETASLESRVLDCVRYFLLFGQNTGMSLETSARDWSRVIGELKSSPVGFYNQVGEQLQRLLVPTREEEEFLGFRSEAPGLIRHAEASDLVTKNLKQLQRYLEMIPDFTKNVDVMAQFSGSVNQSVEFLSSDEYTEGEKLVSQYILKLYPGIDWRQIFDWVKDQNPRTKKDISKIIFNGHNNYEELPSFARVSGMTTVHETFLGELRDWNRHRAWGRELSWPMMHGVNVDYEKILQIFSSGYGQPKYLTEVNAFSELLEEFKSDQKEYYGRLADFISEVSSIVYARNTVGMDYSAIINLLPLGHKATFFMHGDPKQALYKTHQRVRNGGHINYRVSAFEENQLIAGSDPCLEGLRLQDEPDPASSEEFFDRS